MKILNLKSLNVRYQFSCRVKDKVDDEMHTLWVQIDHEARIPINNELHRQITKNV